MKLNKIFMALAATAMVGCSSEDLSDFSAKQAPEDARMIQLDQNFALAGVGVEDATTRTHWDWAGTPGASALVNKFLPIWLTAPAGGNTIGADANLAAQAVGLCWLGQGAVGTDVYTNYEFYHFGWLNNGATGAEFECNQLTNGSLYNEITVAAGDAAGAEATPGKFTLPAKSATAGLNYNTGIYKTENKAIFGGQYIVYYPYNEDFKNAGTIPAVAKTTWNNVSTAFNTPEIGKYTFRYSSPVLIEGGNQAADFGMYNLSTLVQLRVACPVGDAAIGDKIDQIVLYSANEQLLKQANLAADQIAAGQTGTNLYASTEGARTIVANFAAPVTLAATTGAVTSAYITVLPTTVEDLVVLVHNSTDGTWATIALPNTVFEAGKAKRLDITVADADFTADYIAVDEASLVQAVTEANNAATTTATNHATVTVIGDITLTADPLIETGTFAKSLWIDITGDDIIVPENVTFTAETNMLSNIRVLGKSCCSNPLWTGGRLTIKGGTVNNVTMEPTEANATTPAQYTQYNPMVTYNGAATVAAGKTFDVQAGNVVVNANVQHKGAITIAEGAFVTVNGTGGLNFMGSTVVNDGTIEVMKDGKSDMTDASGNATATDGMRMTNNGTFIHNVDAAVGTAVQKMVQNGEYRCKVNEQIKLDDAFLQWTACSVIEMVNAGPYTYNLGTAEGIAPAGYKHNGKFIDIEVNGGGLTTFNNPIISSGNGDSKEIQVGNLTVVAGAGGLDVDFIQGTGKRTLTVNGDFNVNQATTLTDSRAITVTNNLNVTNMLTYLPANGKLAVTKDIKVNGGAFNASLVDCINITCANFALSSGATATFGNRTDGAAKTMVVSGTITNSPGCMFNMIKANQNGAGSVLAWITCKQLIVGGGFPNGQPRVE